jgi:hypothetical protein
VNVKETRMSSYLAAITRLQIVMFINNNFHGNNGNKYDASLNAIHLSSGLFGVHSQLLSSLLQLMLVHFGSPPS